MSKSVKKYISLACILFGIGIIPFVLYFIRIIYSKLDFLTLNGNLKFEFLEPLDQLLVIVAILIPIGIIVTGIIMYKKSDSKDEE